MFTVLFWKKAWIWLKHYWYWPVIIVLFLFSLLSGTSAKQRLVDLLFKQREAYEKELQIIKNANLQKDHEKNNILGKHKEELEKIQEEHNVSLEDLERDKQEELARTIEEHKGSPEALAKQIAKILSVEYYKKNR